MRIDFIADTNFLVYIHEGNDVVSSFLGYNFGISFISEVELLGFKGISKADETKLKQLISDCFGIEWNSRIRDQAIELKKKYNLKLPDTIIASTSLVYGLPLVTADKGFSKVKELDLILIDV